MEPQVTPAGRVDALRSKLPLDGAALRHEQPVPLPGAGAHRLHHSSPAERAAKLARFLGWFSIGLGVAQLLAPRQMSRAIGVGEHPNLMRACGARELVSGVGILSQPRPAGFLWSRVAGDVLDLALLGNAARKAGSPRSRLGVAGAAVAGVAILDLLASMQEPEQSAQVADVEFEKTMVVNRSPEECYRRWRQLEDLPQFMRHLVEVRELEAGRTYWKARGPLEFTIEWHSDIIADQPNELLAWRSSPDSDIDTEGSVRFERAPGGRGTLLHVQMRYRPPGGKPGELIARLFGREPSQQIGEDLRRFKWLLETGEIPTTVGQPAGERGAWNRYVIRKGAPG